MICPVCGKEMKYCEKVKVEPVKSNGLMSHMYGINTSEYLEKYECEICKRLDFKKVKSTK